MFIVHRTFFFFFFFFKPKGLHREMLIELNSLLNERLCCCGLEAKKLLNITWDTYKCIYVCVHI